MSLKVGELLTISLLPTLSGLPSVFEGAPTIVVEPAGLVSDITIAGDNLSGTATVLAAGAFTVTATVDNLQGDPVGALVGTVSGEFLAADPVVLADQLDVTVS